MPRLEATGRPLTARRPQASRPSARPPSSDPPQALGKRPHRAPTGRGPGGHPGHEGQARAVRPVAAVEMVIPVQPMGCHRGQYLWCGDNPPPHRHVDALMTGVATRTPPHRHGRDDRTTACDAAVRGEAAPAWRPTPHHLAERVRPAAYLG